MSTDNIVTMPTPKHVLAQRYRAAVERTKHGRSEWIEGQIDQALILREARDQFEDDNTAFGTWIAENELDWLSRDDRASMIWLARATNNSRDDLHFLFDKIADERWSPTTLMRMCQDKRMHFIHTLSDAVTKIAASHDDPLLVAEAGSSIQSKTPEIVQLAENPQKVAPIASPQQADTPIPTITSVTAASKTSGRIDNKRSPFYGRERAAEVHAVYQSKQTRYAIRRVLDGRGGNDLWPMILAAIDAGFLTSTGYNAHHHSPVTLRVLFPHDGAKNYCRGVDLSTPQAIKRVRDFILPAMIANKDAILANPSRIGQIMHLAEHDARCKANEAASTARLAERRAAMPKHEYEIVMYGEVFWPNPKPEITSYTYDQCRAACWYFQEINQLYTLIPSGREDFKGRAINMRFSTRWFSQYADREMEGEQRDRMKMVFRLVHAMANAMEQNPSGASKRPPCPTTDGEWP